MNENDRDGPNVITTNNTKGKSVSKHVIINLPVANLRTMAFWKALGYAHNPQSSDDTGACIVVSERFLYGAHAREVALLHAESHLRH